MWIPMLMILCYLLEKFVAIFTAVIVFGYLLTLFRYYYYNIRNILRESGFYYGEVRHTRLKGGAIHHLRYPIFFAYLDLDEIEKLQRVSGGRNLWPLFSVNHPWSSFCSFDYAQHLKDFPASTNIVEGIDSFQLKVKSFLLSRSNRKFIWPDNYRSIRLLTHLTYFGYCFNPISIYYLFNLKDSNSNDEAGNHERQSEYLEGLIAEVSNTPWIEMHSYALHETVEGVSVVRKIEGNTQWPLIGANWKKEFHVSPFMEMDYLYSFDFYTPQSDRLKCSSKMLKLSNNELWFTASFELKKLSFTPWNILYVLLHYPLHTRHIQVLIHIEAVKLFWKGVPTFSHPHGTDVDFGFGITGQRLGAALWYFIQPFHWMLSSLSQKKQLGEEKN